MRYINSSIEISMRGRIQRECRMNRATFVPVGRSHTAQVPERPSRCIWSVRYARRVYFQEVYLVQRVVVGRSCEEHQEHEEQPAGCEEEGEEREWHF